MTSIKGIKGYLSSLGGKLASRITINSSFILRRFATADFSSRSIMCGGKRYPTLTSASPSFFALAISKLSEIFAKIARILLTNLYYASIMEV